MVEIIIIIIISLFQEGNILSKTAYLQYGLHKMNKSIIQECQIINKRAKISKHAYISTQHLTRGPRGPWVAHLRKRSKVTVEPIIENPRA